MTSDKRSRTDGPKLVLLTGAPGTGKTTLALAVLERIPAVYLDNNFIPDSFFPETRRGERYESYRPRFYAALYRIVEENLHVGNTVLLVAPHIKEMQSAAWETRIRDMLGRTRATLLVIHCVCTSDTLRSRLESRGEARDHWKLDNWKTFLEEEPLNVQIPFDHIIINTERDVHSNVERAVNYVLSNAISTKET